MLELLVGCIIVALFVMITEVYDYLCNKFGKELIFMIGTLMAMAYVIGSAVLHSFNN